MFLCRKCDWISISRRNWCSTPAFDSCDLNRTCQRRIFVFRFFSRSAGECRASACMLGDGSCGFRVLWRVSMCSQCARIVAWLKIHPGYAHAGTSSNTGKTCTSSKGRLMCARYHGIPWAPRCSGFSSHARDRRCRTFPFRGAFRCRSLRAPSSWHCHLLAPGSCPAVRMLTVSQGCWQGLNFAQACSPKMKKYTQSYWAQTWVVMCKFASRVAAASTATKTSYSWAFA